MMVHSLLARRGRYGRYRPKITKIISPANLSVSPLFSPHVVIDFLFFQLLPFFFIYRFAPLFALPSYHHLHYPKFVISRFIPPFVVSHYLIRFCCFTFSLALFVPFFCLVFFHRMFGGLSVLYHGEF